MDDKIVTSVLSTYGVNTEDRHGKVPLSCLIITYMVSIHLVTALAQAEIQTRGETAFIDDAKISSLTRIGSISNYTSSMTLPLAYNVAAGLSKYLKSGGLDKTKTNIDSVVRNIVADPLLAKYLTASVDTISSMAMAVSVGYFRCVLHYVSHISAKPLTAIIEMSRKQKDMQESIRHSYTVRYGSEHLHYSGSQLVDLAEGIVPHLMNGAVPVDRIPKSVCESRDSIRSAFSAVRRAIEAGDLVEDIHFQDGASISVIRDIARNHGYVESDDIRINGDPMIDVATCISTARHLSYCISQDLSRMLK